MLSCVGFSVTPWTVACQALCPWNFPGKSTRMGCHFLLKGIFLTQGSNSHVLHWQADSLLTASLLSPFLSQSPGQPLNA